MPPLLTTVDSDSYYFTIGSEDEFYDSKAQHELMQQYEEMGYNTLSYIGNHDIQNETLLNIIRQIQEQKR